jgi:hypothetical protein
MRGKKSLSDQGILSSAPQEKYVYDTDASELRYQEC